MRRGATGMFSRREILSTAAGCALAPFASFTRGAAGGSGFAAGAEDWTRTAVRARYWTSVALARRDCAACHPATTDLSRPHAHDPATVKCLLCAHGCTVRAGERGRCRARINVKGELRSLVYGRPLAVHVDPIEKKPFYHFLPGSSALSLRHAPAARSGAGSARTGSSRSPRPATCRRRSPRPLTWSRRRRIAPARPSSPSPTTSRPSSRSTSSTLRSEARGRGIRSVLVSCGFMNEAPLADMCRSLAAVKIDLKGFSEEFYRNGLRRRAEAGAAKHQADREERPRTSRSSTSSCRRSTTPRPCCRASSAWVAGELGPDVPVHFTRFHPDYQLLNLPPTPVATLERAREIAMATGLRYAYVGNVPGHPGNHTYCPRLPEGRRRARQLLRDRDERHRRRAAGSAGGPSRECGHRRGARVHGCTGGASVGQASRLSHGCRVHGW